MIAHKFLSHQIAHDTRILIVGTFNPDIPNGPDFFYGRPRNHLWTLLPACFEEPDLKKATLAEKKVFMRRYQIDFVDLIEALSAVPEGDENNVADEFIDQYVYRWNDIISLLKDHPSIKHVFITRKTLAGIPNIARKIQELSSYCNYSAVNISLLPTPARYYNAGKQAAWKEAFFQT